MCVCILGTSCLRAKMHYYYLWQFAKKLRWRHRMKFHENCLPPKWRAGSAPALCNVWTACHRLFVFLLLHLCYFVVWVTKINSIKHCHYHTSCFFKRRNCEIFRKSQILGVCFILPHWRRIMTFRGKYSRINLVCSKEPNRHLSSVFYCH